MEANVTTYQGKPCSWQKTCSGFAESKIRSYTACRRRRIPVARQKMHGLPSRTEIERCYRILELDPDSSSTLVNASWRKLVDEWRPDRFVGDPVLHARAETRVNELNRVHAILMTHLGSESPSTLGPVVRNHGAVRTKWSLRRPAIGVTAFAGVALAAVLIAHPSSVQKIKSAPGVTTGAGPVATVPAVAPLTLVAPAAVAPESVASLEVHEPEILLIARAELTVSVSLVADGRILLADTTLHAGQTASVPRLGATYIKYSAGENLEVEIDGHRFAMPTPGASRAKLN